MLSFLILIPLVSMTEAKNPRQPYLINFVALTADMIGISYLSFILSKINCKISFILKMILFPPQSTCTLQADNQSTPNMISNFIYPSLIKLISVFVSPNYHFTILIFSASYHLYTYGSGYNQMKFLEIQFTCKSVRYKGVGGFRIK